MRRLAAALAAFLALAAAPAVARDAPSSARLTLTGAPGSGTGSSVAALGGGVLAIGEPFANGDRGVVHVVLDTSGSGTVSLDDPALRQFEIFGGRVFRAGLAVADAGDVNGDGRDDLILTAPRANGYKVPGRAYVVYGKDDTTPVDLTALTRQQGFLIDRIVPGSPNATALDVAGAGDVDGDGRADVVLAGANGDAVLVYANGKRLTIVTGGKGAPTVANAGDVNGDGRPDLVLGVPSFRAPGQRFPVNSVFVLFGRKRTGTLHLTALGTRGFRVGGLSAQRIDRPAVAAAGDVNHDSRADIALIADSGGTVGRRARAAIVFGSRSTATVDADHPGSRGIRVLGEPADGHVSILGSIAGVGDGAIALGAATGPAAGPYQSSVIMRSASGEIDRLTGPPPTASCGAPGIGAALGALGSDLVIGAPALNGCGGEVLLIPRA